MREIIQILFLGYLAILAVIDVRSRKLPVWLLAAGGIGVVIYRCVRREIPWELCVFGAAVGGVFFMISKATREGFGYGDSLLIALLGVGVGFWNLIHLLMLSFFLAAVFSAMALVLGKFQRKTAVPFVPFLGIGYFWVRILWSGG